MPDIDLQAAISDKLGVEGLDGVTVKPTHTAMPMDAAQKGPTGGTPVEAVDLPVVEGLGLGVGLHGSSLGSFGGSGESTIVHTGPIRQAAQSGAAHVQAIDELIVEMQQDMAASDASWVGEAGEWYRDVFATGSAKCRKALEEYVLFTNELVSYADEYEGADSRAQQIADAAPQANA